MSAIAGETEVSGKTNSRRAVLIGALGGLGAWAAGAVSGVARVRAVDGEPMLVGGEYTSSSVTSLTNSTGDAEVFRAVTNGAGNGIFGQSETGVAVYANCGQGQAVFANTNGAEAVWAQTDSDDTAAIVGKQTGAFLTGVLGISGDTQPAVRAKTGVHGFADQDSASRGVIGESPAGQGVRGETTTGAAIFGTAGTGYAIRGSGRLRFDRVSGSVGIPAGSKSVTLSPGVDVNSNTFVLLSPKVNIGTRALWFTTNSSANTFTIRMSATRSTRTPIAWLLVG